MAANHINLRGPCDKLYQHFNHEVYGGDGLDVHVGSMLKPYVISQLVHPWPRLDQGLVRSLK